MDEKLTIVLAAFVGAAIPTLYNIWSTVIANKERRAEKMRDIQQLLYSECLQSLQDSMDRMHEAKSQREVFSALQKSINKAVIYADNETASMLLKYYYSFVHSGDKLSSDDHKSHQLKIVNAMRKHLGLKDLDYFALIGNHLQ
jgi:hypothetical protein